jgi:hypothetical protein
LLSLGLQRQYTRQYTRSIACCTDMHAGFAFAFYTKENKCLVLLLSIRPAFVVNGVKAHTQRLGGHSWNIWKPD